jgi:hypothetical protein
MPSGVFKVTDIPEAEVPNVLATYQWQHPTKVEKEKQANGLWTVIATFSGSGSSTEKFSG